jgi:hypothetical protein
VAPRSRWSPDEPILKDDTRMTNAVRDLGLQQVRLYRVDEVAI